MNLDQVNKWLMLVANLGVLAGIVLVAFQLKENTDATRVQSAYALNDTTIGGDIGCMGDTTADAVTAAYFKPQELTEAQLMQTWCSVELSALAAQNSWLAYREGRASQETWDAAQGSLLAYMDFGVGRIIRNNIKSGLQFPQEIVDEIDKAFAQGDGSADLRFRGMLTEVRKLGRDRAIADAKMQSDDPATTGTTSAAH